MVTDCWNSSATYMAKLRIFVIYSKKGVNDLGILRLLSPMNYKISIFNH